MAILLKLAEGFGRVLRASVSLEVLCLPRHCLVGWGGASISWFVVGRATWIWTWTWTWENLNFFHALEGVVRREPLKWDSLPVLSWKWGDCTSHLILPLTSTSISSFFFPLETTRLKTFVCNVQMVPLTWQTHLYLSLSPRTSPIPYQRGSG